MTLGPVHGRAELEGIERSERMETEQPGSPAFDRLDVDHDVGRMHELTES